MVSELMRVILLPLLLVLLPGPVTGGPVAGSKSPVGRNCGDVLLLQAATGHLMTPLLRPVDPLALPDSSPLATPADVRIWSTADDFLPGRFQRTEVLPNADQVTLARTWRDGVIVNDDTGVAFQGFPSLAYGPTGTLYAVWRDERNGDADVCYACSYDDGQTWTSNTKVNDDQQSVGQDHPTIAVDEEGVVYVAWTDERTGGPMIFFASSTNDGQDWVDNMALSGLDSDHQSRPGLVALGAGRLFAAWEDGRNGNLDIYAATSGDGGGTWSPAVRVNDDISKRDQLNPSVAINGRNDLFVAWRDDRNGPDEAPDPDIYVAGSANGGLTWSDNVRVNDDGNGRPQDFPSLAAQGRLLFLAWEDNRNGGTFFDADIYAAHSTDDGQTWSKNVRVNNDDSGAAQLHPSLTVDADYVLYAAWRDDQNAMLKAPASDIYFAVSNNLGASWMVQAPVDDGGVNGPQDFPSLAANNKGGVFAVWQAAPQGDSDIVSAAWPNWERFANAGLYTSPIFDGRNVTTWRELTWTGAELPGTQIVMAARSGNDPLAPLSWSRWVTFTVSPAALGDVPPDRFFQWRAFMQTGDASLSPALDDVGLAYETCHDYNDNWIVDMADVLAVAFRWGSALGDGLYKPEYDLNRDQEINALDISLVAGQWSRTCPLD